MHTHAMGLGEHGRGLRNLSLGRQWPNLVQKNNMLLMIMLNDFQ